MKTAVAAPAPEPERQRLLAAIAELFDQLLNVNASFEVPTLNATIHIPLRHLGTLPLGKLKRR